MENRTEVAESGLGKREQCFRKKRGLWQGCRAAPGRAGKREAALNANGPGQLRRTVTLRPWQERAGSPHTLPRPAGDWGCSQRGLKFPWVSASFSQGAVSASQRAQKWTWSRTGSAAGPPSQAVPAPKGTEQAGEHGKDSAHPLERVQAGGTPGAGPEAFEAHGSSAGRLSARPTGPSRGPAGGTRRAGGEEQVPNAPSCHLP